MGKVVKDHWTSRRPLQVSPPPRPRFRLKERKEKNRAPMYTAVSVRDPLVMVAQPGCSQMSTRSTGISLILQGPVHAWSMSACQLKEDCFLLKTKEDCGKRHFFAANSNQYWAACCTGVFRACRSFSKWRCMSFELRDDEPSRLPSCCKNYPQKLQYSIH